MPIASKASKTGALMLHCNVVRSSFTCPRRNQRVETLFGTFLLRNGDFPRIVFQRQLLVSRVCILLPDTFCSNIILATTDLIPLLKLGQLGKYQSPVNGEEKDPATQPEHLVFQTEIRPIFLKHSYLKELSLDTNGQEIIMI